ncbi:MAG: transglycosylase SLT domain-containing protein [Rhodocyclaceae bacterium]|nr:transglycosylase SLT domain-containing protein [Rhodocyclaceae bacterium]
MATSPRPACRDLISLLALVFCAVSPALTIAADEPGPEQLRAMREEARALEHGEGIPKNPARAIELYCEAARAGDPEAQYGIGWMHANGRGVPRNDGLAAYFFSLAAAQGHAPSHDMLRFVGPPATEPPECMRPRQIVSESRGDDDGDIVLLNEKQRRMADLVRRLAPEYGIEPKLALAVALTESNFNPDAVSSKNAQGLMQLIPDTSIRFNVRKPFDPEQNVRGGLAYLRWLLAYFKGNVALVAAAYNAGEGAVNRYLGIPPYAETRGYVQRIVRAFPRPDHPFDAAITAPSPELPKILRRKTGTHS